MCACVRACECVFVCPDLRIYFFFCIFSCLLASANKYCFFLALSHANGLDTDKLFFVIVLSFYLFELCLTGVFVVMSQSMIH